MWLSANPTNKIFFDFEDLLAVCVLEVQLKRFARVERAHFDTEVSLTNRGFLVCVH